ncbi:hypothetical protein B5M09_002229 [Aphanomyces astaci]|uniref:O-GlcNAc transferase C-terminal domain-containing protein n=1 Tax=Aphanomyces astaci TaxID=112090 RepID=A0A3R7W3K4_APHAT|nr:hypothetical protein B5M09_002229 [Aphanomyces astaci]
MEYVERWGGRYMVLVNSDNTFLRMQTPQWVESGTVAVAVRQNDGVRLIDLARNSTTLSFLSPLFTITLQPNVLQCLHRIEALLAINAPRTAVDTFALCAPHATITSVVSKFPPRLDQTPSPNEEYAGFYNQVASLFRQSPFHSTDFVRHVLLESSYFAVYYAASATALQYHNLGTASLLTGHFHMAASNFVLTSTANSVTTCDAALAFFLAGDYIPAHKCPRWDVHMGVTLHFDSVFVQNLYETITLMGVFLDELGAFHESLVHFGHGLRLCGKASGLHIRMATSVPIVFDSKVDMDTFILDFPRRVLSLDMLGVSHDVARYNRPEFAGHLQWTITPPTMFVGYQGVDVAPLQAAVATMYDRLYPVLSRPLDSLPPPPLQIPNKTTVGFVSSWFRTHSVGKLIQRVIESLDRDRFEVVVFAASHFFPLKGDDDPITTAIERAANRFVQLPSDQEMAMHVLLREDLDVLVYPEVGMDAWVYFLAGRRLARVQCMFWGHPITTGLSTIDYFIASGITIPCFHAMIEYFFSDFYDAGGQPNPHSDYHMYGGASYSEQLVLFADLSTYFPPPAAAVPPDPSSSVRAMLHLPPSPSRIYLCPQTLMKLHVDFDAAILGILDRDPGGTIVLLYSNKQVLWKDQVHRRLRQSTLGRRVVFIETMPYAMFMQLLAAVDVMVDPFPPVITLPSRQTVLQLAAGFYRYMSVSDSLVAASVDEFVTFAVAMATNATLKGATQAAIRHRYHVLFHDDNSSKTHTEWNTFLANIT